MDVDLNKLTEPLAEEQISWAPQRAGKKDGKVWAMIVPFADARDLMDRLDEAVGPENWQDEYYEGPAGGVKCRLSLRINGDWISKEDGSENTNIEEVKGGFTTAFRRACVKWNVMGVRVLYRAVHGTIFAPNVYSDADRGQFKASLGKKHGYEEYSFDPPTILGGNSKPSSPPKKKRKQKRKKKQPATREQKKLLSKLLKSSKITGSERRDITKAMKEDGTKKRASAIIERVKQYIEDREEVLEMDPERLHLVTLEVNGGEFTGEEFVEYYREVEASNAGGDE